MRNPRWKKYRGEPSRRSREKILRPAPFGTGRVCGRLRCPTGRAEWGGDFVEPRVELDCLRQFLDAEINRALTDALSVGVTVYAV